MSNLFVPIIPANLTWRDGLPYSLDYQDVYQSAAGAIEQSNHVFINGNRLLERWANLDNEQVFHIAETGFGTGLNFLVTWKLWEQYAPQARLNFISVEQHPLTKEDLRRCFDNWPELREYSEQLLNSYPPLIPGFHQLHFSKGKVTLILILAEASSGLEQLLVCGDSLLEEQLRTASIDAWYLDGFAPKKNEQMWSEQLLGIIAMLSKEGTTIATYTVAAKVKLLLKRYGFIWQKHKGLGIKRHMLTACMTTKDYYRHTRHTLGLLAPLIRPNQKRRLLSEQGWRGVSPLMLWLNVGGRLKSLRAVIL